MPTLSERLSGWVSYCSTDDWTGDLADDLEEAARVLSALESGGPEVAELLERAKELEGGCPEIIDSAEALARDLRTWAACEGARIAAETKLAAVEGLPGKWHEANVLTIADCHVIANSGVVKATVDLLASQLKAALAGAGEEREVLG